MRKQRTWSVNTFWRRWHFVLCEKLFSYVFLWRWRSKGLVVLKFERCEHRDDTYCRWRWRRCEVLIVFWKMKNIIFNNKEKILLQFKNTHIKKLKHLIFRSSTTTSKMAPKTTNTFNTAVTSSTSWSIQDKWVNQPRQEGTNTWTKRLYYWKGQSLQLPQQPSPSRNTSPLLGQELHVAALQAGELNGVDCSGLYHDVNRILHTFTNNPMHTNITKSEHLALENLRNDKDHIIVTTDKGVALVVMDKTEYIIKCGVLLQDNSVYQHLSKDTSPTIL